MTTRSRYTAAITDKPWWLAGGIPSDGCYAAYQAKSASSQAASLTNLNNPSIYRLIGAGNPGWSTITGWTFNGNKDHYDTGLLGYKSGSWIVKYSDVIAQISPAFGNYTANFEIDFYPKYTDNSQYFRMGQSFKRAAPADFASGVAAASSQAAYWNGTKVGSITGVYTGTPTSTIHIANLEPQDNIDSHATIYIQAIAFYSAVLTDYQITALTNAMNAL